MRDRCEVYMFSKNNIGRCAVMYTWLYIYGVFMDVHIYVHSADGPEYMYDVYIRLVDYSVYHH